MRRLVLALAAVALVAAGPGRARAKPPPRHLTLPLPPPMPRATTTGFATSGGVKIYYATYGAGDPVILLHGGLGNADHWAFQVPALAAKFRVIAIDSRNQGRSGFSTAKLSYHAMAGDVLAVMDALGLRTAALVGWSDGGEIALDLAIHHPERVAKLFVFGANYDATGSKPRKGGSSTTFNRYAAKCRADYRRLARHRHSFADLVTSLIPVWKSPISFTKDQLRGIRAPTVVADGEHDEIIKLAHIEEMARLIPNARVVVFKDASHFALWQDPKGFNQALIEFLVNPGRAGAH